MLPFLDVVIHVISIKCYIVLPIVSSQLY